MSRFVFPEWTETFKKLVTLLFVGGPIYLVGLTCYGVTPEALRIGYQPKQPVPYSHQLHAGELGIDCRYCHATVDRSPAAGIPAASVCMNCHATILPSSEALAPVRNAFDKKEPLAWIKVHDLPDYVYFDHSAHVTRGVGCESCHGRIDRMEEVYQAKALTMEWCLNCHHEPYEHLREPALATQMGLQTSAEQGRALAEKYRIVPPINCSTCHR